MQHPSQAPASPRLVPTATDAGHTVSLLRGRHVVETLGAELDELNATTGCPITARRPWVQAWVNAYQPMAPWAVAVRDPRGRLDGAALLSTRAGDAWDEITPLGRRQADRGWLPARNPAAAASLGAGLAAALGNWPRPWVLRLGQLPAGDPTTAAVVRHVEGARVVPGLPIPKVVAGPGGRSLDHHLSKGLRKQLRKSRNRLDDDGRAYVLSFETELAVMEEVLHEVEQVHRAREIHASRTSELEFRPGLEFWRRMILDHASQREAELALLRIEGEVAAYVVSLLDHATWRVFDGRFATAWGRYSPGRLLESAVLERALLTARYAELDWMNGCASEKLLTANAVDPTEHLLASAPGLTVDLGELVRAVPVPDGPFQSLASGAR